MSDSFEPTHSDRDIAVPSVTRKPAVVRVVKAILNENSSYTPPRDEDLAMEAAVQNLKLWCDRY